MATLIQFIFIFIGFVLSQRLPRPRPPADELNYDCLADTRLPPFVPTLPRLTSGVLHCPQSDTTWWVMLRWIAQFKEYYPNILITAPVNGSGIAGPCLRDSTCNMSIIAREMLLAEESVFVDTWKYKPFEVAISAGTYSALGYTDVNTIMVHPSNPLSQLTLAELDAIFSTTRNRRYIEDITTWGQLGVTGELSDKPIHLVGVKIPNGFEYFLNRTVLLGGTWKANITTRDTVFELATIVSLDPQAIGYTGLAYLNASVKLIALGKEGDWPYTDSGDVSYYRPDKSYACRREFTLSRLIYLYANKTPGKPLNPLIKEFLNYLLSYEGQKAVQDDMIFLPLPLNVVKNLRKQLGLTITTRKFRPSQIVLQSQ